MFPRALRLGRERDVQAILRKGRRYSATGMTLRILKTNLTHPRATIVVGTKIDKRATVRNRIKRQLRHVLREELLQASAMAEGIDIMVSLRPEILKMDNTSRRRALRFALTQARHSTNLSQKK